MKSQKDVPVVTGMCIDGSVVKCSLGPAYLSEPG